MKIRLRGLVAFSVLMATACGAVSEPNHAGTPDAGTPTCDPAAPFDRPVPVAGLSGDIYVVNARLSSDELTAYIVAKIGATDWNLFVTQRASPSGMFAVPNPLTSVNSSADENESTISSDGRALIFSSNRVLTEGTHIYIASRGSTLGDFGDLSLLLSINSTIATDNDSMPYLSADNGELWFTSNRAGGLGAEDIYRSTKIGQAFTAPVAVVELSSSMREFTPVISADKLTVYFSSDRPGGTGQFDIWTSHRTTVSDGFPKPVVVPNINSSLNDFAGYLSSDNCRLYLRSDSSGTPNIYMAVRHPS
jgi:WD40-like Beta Propeller Repeat